MAKRRRPKAAAVHAALLRKAHKDGTYERLLAQQDGRCGICFRTPEEVTRPGKRVNRLDIDHHHGDMRIRGLLCRGDNLWLRKGLTPEKLRAAAAYLEAAGE